jgi:hypothetical protein
MPDISKLMLNLGVTDAYCRPRIQVLARGSMLSNGLQHVDSFVINRRGFEVSN